MPRELTTEDVRTYWERFAHKYDRSIGFWDRVLSIERDGAEDARRALEELASFTEVPA